MITLEEAYSIIDNLNANAYDLVYDLWVLADKETDNIEAEYLREEASAKQQEVFLTLYHDLPEDVRENITHYLYSDEDFLSCFYDYRGREIE